MAKRTTITLDDDVASKLDREARRTGEPFRATVNRILRVGLNPPRPPKPAKPFKIRARDLGLRPGLELDNVEELLDQVDGPLRR